MSEFGFGRSYQAGLNAALNQQVSERIVSALHNRQERNWAQQQVLALQLQLQAAQTEVLRLRQEGQHLRAENIELRRFANWSMQHIDRLNGELKTSDAELHRVTRAWTNG